MRRGRDSNPDRDQKSVEQLEMPMRKQIQHPSAPKRCGNEKCGLWFPRTQECFDLDDTRSRLQSYCVECKDNWETTTEAHFMRLSSFLENEEPAAWSKWQAKEGGALGEFLRKLEAQGGVCFHCGAGLREWQYSGHNLDRIDNTDGILHAPENTKFACNPCNKTRGRTRWRAWRERVKGIVSQYGWGLVSWSEECDQFKRQVRRVCRHLAVGPSHLEYEPVGDGNIWLSTKAAAR